MTAPPVEIQISYNPATLRGAFALQAANDNAIWERLTQRALAIEADYELAATSLDVPWTTVRRSTSSQFAARTDLKAGRYERVGAGDLESMWTKIFRCCCLLARWL